MSVSTTPCTPGTQTVHFRTDDVPVASMVAGVGYCLPLPVGNSSVNDYEQFLAFQVRETAGQAATAGAVNAFLTLDPTGWRSYDDAIN